MTPLPPWPFPLLAIDVLYRYLRDQVGVDATALAAFETLLAKPIPPRETLPANPTPAADEHGKQFLATFALPESRLRLSEITGISYAQITHWVIRADLLRVLPAYFPDEAQAQEMATRLADVGIIGVQDFAKRGIPPSLVHDPACAALRSALESAQQTAVTLPPAITAVTQTVLVVKGAGAQAQDNTLSVFLKGFWPAVVTTYPDATLTEYLADPALPPSEAASPQKGRIAEIQAGEQRLWVKESYWEPGIRAPGSMPALRLEWRMATYVLGHVIWELLSSPHRSTRRTATTTTQFLRYWGAFFCTYLLVLVPIALSWRDIILGQLTTVITTLNALGGLALPPLLGLTPTMLVGLGIFSLAILLALPPALQTTFILQNAATAPDPQDRRIERLPGVASWLLIPLIGGFLLQPLLYLLFLGMLVAMEGALIGLRKLAWSYRRYSDSDTRFAEWSQGAYGVQKSTTGRWVDRFVLSPWLYRYIVVVAVPIVVLLLLLAKLLRAIPGLAGIGRQIENLATATVSGGLGDVVVYANEPGEAAWIRGALMADIRTFDTRAEVNAIHVFAHSQGTPISFETLFNHLPATLRRKVKTYITIGSVLNYFNQVNWVLDFYFIRRFPRRPYPYTEFDRDFQWINFWNHTDPVTEFAALDAYEDYLTTPAIEPNPAGPTNIRTRGTLLPWTSHSEYWGNVPQVHQPFAKRILFGTRVDDAAANGPRRTGRVSHAFIMRWWIPLAILLLFGFIGLIRMPSLNEMLNYNVPLRVIAGATEAVTFMLRGTATSATPLQGVHLLTGVAWAVVVVGGLSWISQMLATLQRYQNRAT